MLKKLREMRINKGLTMQEVSAAIGISEATLSLYERGMRSPNYETLLKLGKYFNVSASYLLGQEVETMYGDLTYEQMCQLQEYNSRERLDGAYAKLDLVGRQKVADFAEKLAKNPKRQRDPESPYHRRETTETGASSSEETRGTPKEDE